jgi:hypothetical protein
MAAEPERVRGEAPPARRNRKQIEFPPLQTHSKAFEATMVGLSIICVIVVLIIVLATDIGTLTRP